MGAWERAQLLQLSLEMISQIYWNLFKWFLEIEIPTFSCISPSVIWIEKEISLKWLKYIMSTFSFLEWNSHFDEIGWNGQSSLAAACFIVFGHLFQIVLDISTPESSFAVTYWMRGFFTYLSQSLGGAENASENAFMEILYFMEIYILYSIEIYVYIMEIYLKCYGNIFVSNIGRGGECQGMHLRKYCNPKRNQVHTFHIFSFQTKSVDISKTKYLAGSAAQWFKTAGLADSQGNTLGNILGRFSRRDIIFALLCFTLIVCTQALEALQDRGLPHGNLHIGNILIRSQTGGSHGPSLYSLLIDSPGMAVQLSAVPPASSLESSPVTVPRPWAWKASPVWPPWTCTALATSCMRWGVQGSN